MLLTIDDLLRGRAIKSPPTSRARGVRNLILIIALFGFAYGAVMGTYYGQGAPRILQMLFSAVKVPLLLLVTFLIALPSFFVLNSVLGVRSDFAEVLHALLRAQACLTIVLASLAPFTAFWYVSVENYQAAILFNAFLFAVASIAAQFILRSAYRKLIARNPVHRHLLRIWLVLFAFVGIQMGWVLRPFIGNPDRPTQFFRIGAWGNAYVEVARIFWQLVHGR